MKTDQVETIREKIAAAAGEAGEGRRVEETMIGLGYTLVCLDNAACGLAYTFREGLERGCEAFGEAGSLGGRELRELLTWIGGSSLIASSTGLAAANAVLEPPHKQPDRDLLDSLDLQPGERVVTVGRFKPLEPVLERRGVLLEAVEWGESPEPLRHCDVALITATTIINNTLEGLLEIISKAREVVILGPSTPCAPPAFDATPVTLLAGSAVKDTEKVQRVVREGGGTQTMGKALTRWVERV